MNVIPVFSASCTAVPNILAPPPPPPPPPQAAPDVTLSHSRLQRLELHALKAGRLTLACAELETLGLWGCQLAGLVAAGTALPALTQLSVTCAARLADQVRGCGREGEAGGDGDRGVWMGPVYSRGMPLLGAAGCVFLP